MSTPVTTHCSHIRTNGENCKVIPLKGKKLCYHHQRTFDRQQRMDLNFAHRSSMLAHDKADLLFTKLPDGTFYDENSAELFSNLQVPDFEDACSIQVTLSMLFRAQLTGQLPRNISTPLLYNLQIAALNIKNTNFHGRDHYSYQTEDPNPIIEDPSARLAKYALPKPPESEARETENEKRETVFEEREAVLTAV
jgi:hypothetical protein